MAVILEKRALISLEKNGDKFLAVQKTVDRKRGFNFLTFN